MEIEYTFFVIAIISGVVAWFFKPKYVFCITPFMFNLDSFSVISGMSISFFYFAISFPVLIMRYCLLKPKVNCKYPLILFLFCLYILIGALYRGDLLPSIIKAISLSVFAFLFVALIRDYRDIYHIVISFGISGFITSLFYITWGQGLSNLISHEINRGGFLGWNINNIAIQWASAFVIFLIYSFNTKRFKRIFFSIMTGVCGIASFATLSRGIIVAIVIALSFVLIFALTWKKRLIIFVALSAIVPLFTSNILIRFQETDPVENSRTILWKHTINIIHNNLWFGVGEGEGFLKQDIVFRSTQTDALYAHNSYLQCAANWGLPAGILFLIMIIGTILTLFVRRGYFSAIRMAEYQPLILSITACFILYLVAITFLSRAGSKDLYFIMGLCWTALNLEYSKGKKIK